MKLTKSEKEYIRLVKDGKKKADIMSLMGGKNGLNEPEYKRIKESVERKMK